MSLSISSALPLIATQGGLRDLVDKLANEPIIAVDTESNSLYAYREQVCLIQFSTTSSDYLLDPLALDDLSPLGRIFSDEKIEKVFHAAEYDLICLKRDFGFQCTNLFDTMVAASALGREAVGLGDILEAEFGVQMEKQHQRANWGERPLSPQLLAYARLDTHYLIPLRHRLKAELETMGRWPLAAEEFRRICLTSSRDHNPIIKSVEETVWRIRGAMDLEPRQAALLLELCRYRDQVAAALDRPLFKVIGDATLLAVACANPQNLQDLQALPGMSQRQIQRHGRNLLRALQRGRKAAPIYPPRSPKPDERFLSRLESLRKWRKKAADEWRVKSDIILSRDKMFTIAAQNPQNWDELAELMAELPWRLEHFGEQILEAITKAS